MTIKKEIEEISFCVYCRCSKSLCKCKSPEIRYAVWSHVIPSILEAGKEEAQKEKALKPIEVDFGFLGKFNMENKKRFENLMSMQYNGGYKKAAEDYEQQLSSYKQRITEIIKRISRKAKRKGYGGLTWEEVKELLSQIDNHSQEMKSGSKTPDTFKNSKKIFQSPSSGSPNSKEVHSYIPTFWIDENDTKKLKKLKKQLENNQVCECGHNKLYHGWKTTQSKTYINKRYGKTVCSFKGCDCKKFRPKKTAGDSLKDETIKSHGRKNKHGNN